MDSNRLRKPITNECDVFCRYLIKQKPNQYVVNHYVQAHLQNEFYDVSASDYFDRSLIGLARISPIVTILVDAYTRSCFKRSVLRRKLSLLLAVLECSSPAYRYLDSVDSYKMGTLFVIMGAKTVFSFLALLLSIVVMMPLHVLFVMALILMKGLGQKWPKS